MIKEIGSKVILQNAHNGKGNIELHEILNESDMKDNVKVFSKVVVKPNATIGYHKHTNELEAYYITKGSGIFIDENQHRSNVKEGDVCLINSGESHGIENNTDKDLELIALVYPSKWGV